MLYGYIRISTKYQSLERQRKNIIDIYPNAIIVEETFSGTKLVGRDKFIKLINKVKKDDTIIFDSVSRLSRNSQEGIDIYFKLFNKGVNLVFLKEPYINTSVYANKLDINNNIFIDDPKLNDTIIKGIREYLQELAINQIKITFDQAEKEVIDIRQRVKEGLYLAKLNGKQIGGVKGQKRIIKKEIKSKKLIKKYAKTFGGKFNDTETIAMINGLDKDFSITRKTYYKYKKELIIDLIENEDADSFI